MIFKKRGWAQDGTFYLSLLGNSGGNVTGEHLDARGIGRVGDLQVLSNIETNETFRLYECWLEKPWGRATVLAGLRDLNADFYASEYAALFSNSSFGIGPDVAINAPVSIFNVTAPSIRLKYDFTPRLALQGAIYDGVPGDRADNKTGLGLRISHREGFFHVFELQYQNPFGNRARPGVVKLARWHHTGRFDDLSNADAAGNPFSRRHNWGSYAVFDQRLWQSPKNSERALGFFLQMGGGGPQDRSMIERYLGTGIHLVGTFKGRDQDVFGVAWNQAKTSSALNRATVAQGGVGLTAESLIEIDYRIQVNEYLTLKPVFQIVKNVGGDPTRGESRIFSLRCNVIF